MNTKGAQIENNDEIRNICENKEHLDEGIYKIIDRVNNEFIINTNTGLMYKNGELCNTVKTSEKENGYLYTNIAIINKKGKIEVKSYAQHSIIAMCAHTSQYDSLVDTGINPVANHINNIPWDNRAENLEWTRQGLNTLHGKIVNSIYKHKFYVESLTSTRLVQVVHNQSEVDFVSLIVSITVKDIESYEIAIGKKLTSYWHCKKETDMISQYDLVDFIKWLKKKNHMKETINHNKGLVVFNNNGTVSVL